MGMMVKQYIRRLYHSARRMTMFAAHSVVSFATLRKPIMRERYFKTRGGRWRGRYIAASIMMFCLSTFMLASMDVSGARYVVMPTQEMRANEGEQNRHTIEGMSDSAFDGVTVDGSENEFADQAGMQDVEQLAAVEPASIPTAEVVVAPRPARPNRWTEVLTIEKGGTLGGLLGKAEIPGNDAHAAIKAMGNQLDPSDMRPGQDVKLHFVRSDDGSPLFAGMDVIKSGIETVVVRRSPEDSFEAKTDKKKVITETRAARAKISSSLFADLTKAGVPDGIINQMIKSYSWSIDFQRDIWGDEDVELLYTVNRTEDEAYLRSGQLLYANLVIRGKENPIFYYVKRDGMDDFFLPSGNSVRKALLQTPIDGARISSGYGMRRHPVLGYGKMHKGLDFAAPTGTPIYAAGDGFVEKAQIFSSYGNYVLIRHNDTYKTAYAHMSRYGKGISKGVRVKQGQIIGYVGTTGRSTGPHLHYEVHVSGKQVNPRSVKLPIGDKLSGEDLKAFKARMDALKKDFANTHAKVSPLMVKAPQEGE